jgi:hypothetical protein
MLTKAIAIAAGSLVAGLGAYQLTTNYFDCGSACSDTDAAAVTAVAASEGGSCCPLTTKAEAVTQLVAAESDAACETACETACEEVCDDATACEPSACEGEAAIVMASTTEASACSGEKSACGNTESAPGSVEVLMVANDEGSACSTEKTECSEEKVACEEKTACETEQIASSETSTEVAPG